MFYIKNGCLHLLIINRICSEEVGISSHFILYSRLSKNSPWNTSQSWKEWKVGCFNIVSLQASSELQENIYFLLFAYSEETVNFIAYRKNKHLPSHSALQFPIQTKIFVYVLFLKYLFIMKHVLVTRISFSLVLFSSLSLWRFIWVFVTSF